MAKATKKLHKDEQVLLERIPAKSNLPGQTKVIWWIGRKQKMAKAKASKPKNMPKHKMPDGKMMTEKEMKEMKKKKKMMK